MILLLASVAMAQEDPIRAHLEQARLFLKQGWTDDARKELEKAVATTDGKRHPEVWYLLATTRYELCDFVGARDAASRAHTYSRDEAELETASSFSLFLQEQFGVVRLEAPHPGMTGQISVELETLLLDPGQTAYFRRLQTKLEKHQLLPLTIGLPIGKYSINGRSIDVTAGNIQVVPLASHEVAGGTAAFQLTQIEVSAGMSAWFGPEVRNLLPGADLELAISQPWGPVIFGAMVDWSPRPYVRADGNFGGSALGFGVGGRIGFEIPGLQNVVVRPSIGYRFQTVPGIERFCENDEGWACDRPETPLAIYGIGRAHTPLIELVVDTRDRTRKNGVGFGVKATGEVAMGTLAEESQAIFNGSERSYTMAEAARTWVAFGTRLSFHITFAL